MRSQNSFTCYCLFTAGDTLSESLALARDLAFLKSQITSVLIFIGGVLMNIFFIISNRAFKDFCRIRSSVVICSILKEF